MISLRARWAVAAVLGSGLLLAACGGGEKATQVKATPQEGTVEPMKSALVVAASGAPDAREAYETKMADELRKEGITVERSLDIFGEQLPERADVEQVVSERGFDTVVVAKFAGTRTEGEAGRYEPAITSYYDPWRAGVEEHTSIGEYVAVDTLVFQPEAGTQTPVFSARTETTAPRDADDVVNKTVEESVPELKDAGLF